MQRESMNFDVVIVGGGPAGLSCAIRLKQRAREAGRDVSVCVLDKGSQIGAHIMSGAIIDPRALSEIFPDWQERGAPLETKVTRDVFLLLNQNHAFKLPTPPGLQNQGCYAASLGALTRWLGTQAEALGVEVFAGFAATEVLYGQELYGQGGRVSGVATGDMGRTRTGDPGANFEPGVELRAPYTIFAEGCRGSLSQGVMERFSLRDGVEPQTYALGIKEIWEVAPQKHKPGTAVHCVGWPLDNATYGGAFLYHMEDNLVAIGLIVGLDYENPYRSPFEDMQRFKTHPKIRPLFSGAKRIAFGARTLNEGGFQSIPELVFPGGALIGAAAGFMNVARIKGSHTAMKSAILCADALIEALSRKTPHGELTAYRETLRKSWVWDELYKSRNIRPAFRFGLWGGLAYGALDSYLLRGHAPWTFGHHADHTRLKRAVKTCEIHYPKPDGVLTFDRLTSIHLANIDAGDDQPCHLKLKDESVPLSVNLTLYDGPETRFCPAQVYEFVAGDDGKKRLHINAQNCIHCKACDIKDPTGNIVWVPPEGGSGPNYVNL